MSRAETTDRPDLAVVLLSREPHLVREGFAVVEAARDRGFRATLLELDASLDDDDAVLGRIDGLGSSTTVIGVTADTIERGVGAAGRLVAREDGPVLLFGRVLSLEPGRRRVPTGAATGVVVGPAAPTVVDFLLERADGASKPIAGLDRLDGDLRPRPPRGAWPEGARFPRFVEADLVRLRRVGLPIRLSYGCPRRCAHCVEQPREGGYRARTAADVAAEIVHHRERHNVRRFEFCDLALNGDLRRLEALCDLLLERGYRDLQWWGRALVDGAMPRSMYRKMRLAGCTGLDFDLPCASDPILERIGAGFTADEAGTALARASAAGLSTRVSLVVGLPGEAEQELGETCAWLLENRYNISRIKDVLVCDVEEGSPLWRDHSRFGVCLPSCDPEREWHDGGFNTRAFRDKRARELRVFIEDQLHLPVVGQGPAVSWNDELRESVGKRLLAAAERSTVKNGRFRRANLDLAGVAQGGAALAGPSYLEIDLTNNCNQHCAGCWVHSYLMGEERLQGERRRATLAFDRLKKLIEDARRIGVRRIQLSGAGEPFMHPRIDDVLALVKSLDIELNVITNFTLVDDERAHRMVDLGVDSITVSLWAGTAETYVKTHPTASYELFERIVRVLGGLTEYRRRTGARFPRVKVYNVISNLNCHEINEMIDVAQEAGADLVEFTPIDIIAGRTDSLALSDDQRRQILDQLLGLRRRPDSLQLEEDLVKGSLPGLDEQREFARFVQRHRLPGDFRFELEDIRRWEGFCRRAVHCVRVYEEIQRDSAIFFTFPASECTGCLASVDCSIDPVTLDVRVPYVSLQGFGSFWRRIRGDAADGRDARVVDRVPCSIGYTYARVQATGHVIPCCKAADMPLGNILERGFEDVWLSPVYDEFRRTALVSPKSDPYFAPMECYKVCDNLGHNMAARDKLAGMSGEARSELERAVAGETRSFLATGRKSD